MNHTITTNGFEIVFLILQSINVVFLLLHDWIPLGRLNNLAAIHTQDSIQHRLTVTLIPLIPTAIGLIYSAHYFGRQYPHWLLMLLEITYVILLLGLLRAWWVPYLFVPDPARAARYQVIFSGTHTFLPIRNGLAPDTLHTFFHLNLAATVIFLFLRGHASF